MQNNANNKYSFYNSDIDMFSFAFSNLDSDNVDENSTYYYSSSIDTDSNYTI